MAGSTKLSATMACVLVEVKEKGGRLTRRQGGYWCIPGAPLSQWGTLPSWWASTPTIEALVRRGYMRYTDWQEGRKGKFPIAAEICPERTA